MFSVLFVALAHKSLYHHLVYSRAASANVYQTDSSRLLCSRISQSVNFKFECIYWVAVIESEHIQNDGNNNADHDIARTLLFFFNNLMRYKHANYLLIYRVYNNN